MQAEIDQTSLTEEVLRLFKDFSIDILPRETNSITDFRELIPIGTKVFIGYIDGVQPDEIVSAAKQLRDQEMIPVAHVPARRMLDSNHLERYISELRKHASIDEVLTIGGDPDPPLGPYKSTIELLKSGIMSKQGIKRVGIAFHPEGHLNIESGESWEAIKEKFAYCDGNSIEYYLISQFIVSYEPFFDWLQKIPLDLNNLPIMRPVVPGLVDPTKLFKLARQCGVKASLTNLTKHARTIKKVMTASTPDSTILSMAKYNLSKGKSVISAVHFAPLGAFHDTAAWASAIAAGEFTIADSEDGLFLKVEA